MQTIKQLITAALGYQANIGGRTFYVQACDQGSTLTVTLTDSLGNRNTVMGVGAGAKLTPATGFTTVSITTSADANVQFIITNGDIDVQLTQVGSTITNTNANPVPVSIVSEPGQPFQVINSPSAFHVTIDNPSTHVTVDGTVNVSGATLTATNVGINNTSANPVPVQGLPAGSAVTEVGAVAVGTVTGGAAVLTAAAGRKRAIFYNAGPGKLALTGVNTTTFASAALVLQPGDAWKETDAPHLAWYGISDAGTTVNIQTVS